MENKFLVKLIDGKKSLKIEGDSMPDFIHSALDAYVKKSLVALRMTHCAVHLDREFLGNTPTNAEISTCATRMYGILQINKNFFFSHPEEQKNTIAHELFHVLCIPLKFFVRRSLVDELSPRALKDFGETFNQLEELLTDHVAGLLREVLPPIPDFVQVAWDHQEAFIAREG